MDYDTWLEAPYTSQAEAHEHFEAMQDYIAERYEEVVEDVYRDEHGEYFRISDEGHYDGNDWVAYKDIIDDVGEMKEIAEELEVERDSFGKQLKELKNELKELKKLYSSQKDEEIG